MDIGIILGTVITLILLIVGIIIVNDIVYTANFGGGDGTLYTVMNNIPLLLGIGGIVLAVAWLTR